jgi:hypothetical protein
MIAASQILVLLSIFFGGPLTLIFDIGGTLS